MGNSGGNQGGHTVAVIGAGSWGTALAIQFARAGSNVHLWSRSRQLAAAITASGRNAAYLPDQPLPPGIESTADIALALRDSKDILVAVPSHAFRQTLQLLADNDLAGKRLAWATKGFELETGLLPHEVARSVFGESLPAAVLSGPTFAAEVAAGLPSALTVASTDGDYAQRLARRLATETFRAYVSGDVIGVEVGGATKNVFAIGAGLCDGLGFGANTRIALITRGLAEMTRLGLRLGAQRETFMGLAGMGDLVLTCTDNLSRNRRFGLALAQGSDPKTALGDIGQVVEGYLGARAVRDVAHAHNVDMPIIEQIYRILYEGLNPLDAVRELMLRPVSDES
ncbi:MAG: NAD(P)H-dependent glycerol-3-phosphate dehydrogenase [Gammaproteobacteria bacterium]|jgi:glycerol-3-phosphate dehydrogenase (NAD(P)+)